MFFRKKRGNATPFDPALHRAAVRKSACTGEMTGGYIDRDGGQFHELQLISGPGGFEAFCKTLGVSPDDVETFY